MDHVDNLDGSPPGNNEAARLYVLRSTRLLDSAASESFDRISRLAAHLFDVPIALVSLVDADRQWFKACVGLDVSETAREYAFCDYTIRHSDVMVVEDALLDPRFADNPLVTGDPHIRFYAGAPLVIAGYAMGSLCVIDRVPRRFDAAQCELLKDLAALVITQIELYRSAGRIDDVTQLPNYAQMLEDMADQTREFPAQERTLLLVEVMDHGAFRDAARSIGIKPLEDLLFEISTLLQGLLSASSKLYFIDVGRFALVVVRRGEALDRFVDNLVEMLKKPVANGDLLVEVDVIVGVVELKLELNDTRDALRKAMTTVHQAKTTGVSVRRYEPEYDAGQQRAYAILRDIPRAIAQNEFYLVFQPKLRISSGKFEGVEALIRWSHPEFGNIPPGEFIPLAENTTLIHDLTRWVINAALGQLARLHAEGFPISIAINVSARNLEHPGFVEDLQVACAAHDVPQGMLHIECTEYSGLTAPATLDALHRIRALGMQLSLDDFGTGYSNLTCLTRLPFQLLKVDQSLVMSIDNDERARHLLEGIVVLGHGMGFRLVAEGVETAEVLRHIAQLGFDHAQGYYLSKPLAFDALLDFLRRAVSVAE